MQKNRHLWTYFFRMRRGMTSHLAVFSLTFPPLEKCVCVKTDASTTSKPTSRTSVSRHRGHRLTDIGDVGLGVLEQGVYLML